MKENTTVGEIKEYCANNMCSSRCPYRDICKPDGIPSNWKFDKVKTLVIEMSPEKRAEIGKIEVDINTDRPGNHIVVYLKGGSHED